uniref:Uncharacterized protein n=1 Tax=Graphocephala atropunctata TaxID=36148 RepID=A0A1B6KGI1_9HEMI
MFGKPEHSEASEGHQPGYLPPGRIPGPYQLNEPDLEKTLSDDDKTNSFADSAVRSKFVRKVYLILSVQLGFTTVFNIPFLYMDNVQEFIYDYSWVVFVALAVFVVPYFMLVCCESTRRSFPTNTILLLIMTIGMAGVCGFVTAKLDTEVVFYAFLLTVVVTLSITVLAIFCPFDFTSCQMVMCVVFIVLTVFAMIAAVIVIVTHSRIVNLIYAGICVILFSLFLIFDTQAIIGGRRVSLRPDEYILGAIQIYVDVVEIFLNFLELIGACTEND